MIRIESLLRKEIGLDAASIGSSQIHRTIRLRMKSHGVKKPDEYQKILATSKKELEELIEAVVVTETWFFRDRDPFTAFTQLALEWLAAHPAAVLRVLSAPCSSGEEPYTLAMTLLDAGILPHRFVIDGTDISARVLARAQHGIYGKNSFRGQNLEFRDRHFSRVDSSKAVDSEELMVATHPPSTIHYQLSARVRECVRFHQANLLGDNFLTGHAPYDFIFCRNLLIYFDRATQIRALERLGKMLAPNGMIFVGPAELPLATDSGFESANIPMAFACRKADKAKPKSEKVRKWENGQVGKWESVPVGEQTSPAHFPTRPLSTHPGAAHVATVAPSSLDVARQLADAGKLTEAAAICENHLRKESPTAQVYYLLGLISEASESPESRVPTQDSGLRTLESGKAMEYYRKALYLEPNHYETLLQMTLLLEKNGDAAGARTFKRRAGRIKTLTEA